MLEPRVEHGRLLDDGLALGVVEVVDLQILVTVKRPSLLFLLFSLLLVLLLLLRFLLLQMQTEAVLVREEQSEMMKSPLGLMFK